MFRGVIVKEISSYEDKRGWLKEIYRSDEDFFSPEMSYISHTNFNEVRGPHEHHKQSDFFVFAGPGNFELYLWDNRKSSETFGEKIVMDVGEENNVSVIVPPGIVHGYKSVSKNGSFSINLPDKLYGGAGRKDKVDEIRHENNLDSIFRID